HELLDKRLPFSHSDVDNMGIKFGARLVSDEQWKFLPYNFPPAMWESHQNIDSHIILPFVGKWERIGYNMYEDVFYKGYIASSEQAFYPKEQAQVQVIKKTLKSTVAPTRLQQERLCLRLLNQLKHPNIVGFLGSYTYMEQHHFLFPRLDMDLSEFLQRDTRFGHFESDCTFYTELRGLASALSHIHQLYLDQKAHNGDFQGMGWHHDFQPTKISVSKDKFLLTGFGLESSAESKMLRQPTRSYYAAPEFMDAEEEQTADEATDVWAFGCLIAEIATYMQLSAPGVKAFTEHRSPHGREGWTDHQFYDAHGETKYLAEQWLESLSIFSSDERLIPSLVNISLDALIADPSHRPSLMHVHDQLSLLCLKAHFDSVDEEFSN
ncbi:kinase-like domain-containing protein, partial [Dactylonectria macrodidyma]